MTICITRRKSGVRVPNSPPKTHRLCLWVFFYIKNRRAISIGYRPPVFSGFAFYCFSRQLPAPAGSTAPMAASRASIRQT